MAETIDFDRIARGLMDRTDDEAGQHQIADELRLVWNARGAADIVAIDLALAAAMGGSDAAGPYIKHLDHALRTLDR